MQDVAAPYLDRCREMGFDELAGFITDCLERMHDPDPGGDRPHSIDEFRMVWRLLREKHDAMPPDPPPPMNPLQKARAKRANRGSPVRRSARQPEVQQERPRADAPNVG